MNICNHIIDQSQIIGIGPLRFDSQLSAGLSIVRNFFMLHCRQQSIKIEGSDSFFQSLEDIKDDEEFTAEYEKAKAEITKLIERPSQSFY